MKKSIFPFGNYFGLGFSGIIPSTFKGVVRDQFGEPLMGAHVITMFRNENIGVITNENGEFLIDNARSDENWKISFVGFDDIFFSIPKNGGSQNFIMIENAYQLEGYTGSPTPTKKNSNIGLGFLFGIIAIGFIALNGNQE